MIYKGILRATPRSIIREADRKQLESGGVSNKSARVERGPCGSSAYKEMSPSTGESS